MDFKKTPIVWSAYRRRWVWYKGNKIKLRNYIDVNALVMHARRKKGWLDIDHRANYKLAVMRYGLKGLKHYEDLFYRSIPLPEYRKWWHWVIIWAFAQVDKKNKKMNQFKNYTKTLWGKI